MMATALLAVRLTPDQMLADQWAGGTLAELLPEEIDGWVAVATATPLTVDPVSESRLSQVYTETLSRAYVSADGRTIMVSIAYGRDQRGEGRAHYPDVCYPAQGFAITDVSAGSISLDDNATLDVARLVARRGARIEPVTYWVVVGDRAVSTTIAHKKAIVLQGLAGKVPDGALVRVSSIDSNHSSAYELHDQFVINLWRVTGTEYKNRLFGKPSSKS